MVPMHTPSDKAVDVDVTHYELAGVDEKGWWKRNKSKEGGKRE